MAELLIAKGTLWSVRQSVMLPSCLRVSLLNEGEVAATDAKIRQVIEVERAIVKLVLLADSFHTVEGFWVYSYMTSYRSSVEGPLGCERKYQLPPLLELDMTRKHDKGFH